MRSHGRRPTWMALPAEPIYDEPDSCEDLPPPDEVLCSGSDDEYYENPTERRHKYAAQAQRFLAGKPLFILSASLTGPFTKESGWQNPWRSSTLARDLRRPRRGQAAYQRTSARTDPRPILDGDNQLCDVREERGDAIVRTPKRYDVSRRQDSSDQTQPISVYFPSTVRTSTSLTPVGPYIGDTARARIRTWRDEVQLMAVPREEFWASKPPQTDQGTPTRKRRAAGSEWLRKTIVKRIKSDAPDTCVSPSPALYEESLPSGVSTRSSPPSSIPDYDLPSTSHAGYARQSDRSSSRSKAVVGRRLDHGLHDDPPIGDEDAAELPQGRPYDFHAIDIRRRRRATEESQGGQVPSVAVRNPPSAYDIIETRRGKENGDNRSNPSVSSSLRIQADESFEYCRKLRQGGGTEVAYAKPPASELSLGTKASSNPRAAKGHMDQNTETKCPRTVKNDVFIPPSRTLEVLLEFNEAFDTIQDDEPTPDMVRDDGLGERDATQEDHTDDNTSIIDGPTLVPSSTSGEAESPVEKASPVSKDARIEGGDTRLASDNGHGTRRTISDVSQLAEVGANLAEIANPTAALAPGVSVLQQDDIRNPHGENDYNELSAGADSNSDNISVILPLSQEAWGLGVEQDEQDCEHEDFVQQEHQNRANAIINYDVHASPKKTRSPLGPHSSETGEPGGTMDPCEAEPEIADEIIVAGFGEPHSPAQGTPRVCSPGSPKRTPTPQRGYAPKLQQSPWVEEVIDIPPIPSLATQPVLWTADPPNITSNASQTLPSVTRQTLGSSIQLPALRSFKPLSSPASNDSPLGASNHTLPKPAMEPNRGVILSDSQVHAHPPSTPETKHSSLPTPDFTLSIRSFKEFLTPSPVRTRRYKPVSIQNGQLPSTQILYDAALSNPWKATRKSNRRVKFAPLPGEIVCSPRGAADLVGSEDEGSGQVACDNTESTSRPRSGVASPPLNISQTDLPAENTRFGKHFAAMTRKGPRILRPMRSQRLLPSESQQAYASPGFDAMAEAFIQADRQVTTHEGESGLETHSVHAVGEEGEEPDGVDDVRAVLENLDEFLDSFDVDVELERARADDHGATTEGAGQLSNLGEHMTSLTEVNVWE